MLVYRRFKQPSDVRKRQLLVAHRDLALRRHGDADKLVALPVVSLACLEKPRRAASAFRIGCRRKLLAKPGQVDLENWQRLHFWRKSRPFISTGCFSPSTPRSVGAMSCSDPP